MDGRVQGDGAGAAVDADLVTVLPRPERFVGRVADGVERVAVGVEAHGAVGDLDLRADSAGTAEVSRSGRPKSLIVKMVKPRSDWSTRNTWVSGSNWTVGCAPLYSMWARYRSVDSAPPAMLTVAAPTLILSVASLTPPPGPTAS